MTPALFLKSKMPAQSLGFNGIKRRTLRGERLLAGTVGISRGIDQYTSEACGVGLFGAGDLSGGPWPTMRPRLRAFRAEIDDPVRLFDDVRLCSMIKTVCDETEALRTSRVADVVEVQTAGGSSRM